METEHKTMNTPANRPNLIGGKTIQQFKAEVGHVSNFDEALHRLHTKCGLSVSQSVAVAVKNYPDLYKTYRMAQRVGGR